MPSFWAHWSFDFVKTEAKQTVQPAVTEQSIPVEIDLNHTAAVLIPASSPEPPPVMEAPIKVDTITPSVETTSSLPEADRIEELFNKQDPRLPMWKRSFIKAECLGKKDGLHGYPIMLPITKPRAILSPAA